MQNDVFTKREFSGIFCLAGEEFASSKMEFPVALTVSRKKFVLADDEYCDNNLTSLLYTVASAIVII